MLRGLGAAALVGAVFVLAVRACDRSVTGPMLPGVELVDMLNSSSYVGMVEGGTRGGVRPTVSWGTSTPGPTDYPMSLTGLDYPPYATAAAHVTQTAEAMAGEGVPATWQTAEAGG